MSAYSNIPLLLLLIGALSLLLVPVRCKASSAAQGKISISSETISRLSEKIGASNSSDIAAPFIEVYNANSPSAWNILSRLLAGPVQREDEGDRKDRKDMMDRNTGVSFLLSEGNSLFALKSGDDEEEGFAFVKRKPDASLLYLHSFSLLDESKCLFKIQQALAPLLSPSSPESFKESSSKKEGEGAEEEKARKEYFYVVVNCPLEDVKQVENLLGALINEAYISLQATSTSSSLKGKVELQVQFIAVANGEVDGKLSSSFLNALAPIQDTAKPLPSLIFTSSSSLGVNNKLAVKKEEEMSLPICLQAADATLMWLKQALISSLPLLQKDDANFTSALNRLLKQAEGTYQDKLSELSSSSSKDITSSCKQIGLSKIHRAIFDSLLPLFRRRVLAIQQEVTTFFNDAVAPEALEVTIHILEDLTKIRDETLSRFQRRVAEITPKSAPSSWNIHFELYEFQLRLDEFIASQQLKYKLAGVLSRGRKPVSVSFHLLSTHPLGRDYRQDPIGVKFFEHVFIKLTDHVIVVGGGG